MQMQLASQASLLKENEEQITSLSEQHIAVSIFTTSLYIQHQLSYVVHFRGFHIHITRVPCLCLSVIFCCIIML